MTYNEVLMAVNEMVASGNFTYTNYFWLIFQNWFSFAQFCFSYIMICDMTILGLFGLIKGIQWVLKFKRQEIEN